MAWTITKLDAASRKVTCSEHLHQKEILIRSWSKQSPLNLASVPKHQYVKIVSHSVPVVPYQLSHYCLLILMYFHATSTYSQPLRDMWHLHSWKQLLCVKIDKAFSSSYLDTTQDGNLFWITTRELFQKLCSFLSCKRLPPGNQTRFQILDSLANITLTWIISERDQKKNSV